MSAVLEHLRLPPQNTEAEQYLLGCALGDNAQFDVVGATVPAEAFYRPEHRQLWSAIGTLMRQGAVADIVTVHDATGHPLRELNALAACVATTRHAPHYAAIVAEHWQRRRLIALADDLAAEAFNAEHKSADVIDRTITKLLALQAGARESEPRRLGDLLPDVIDAIERAADGHTDAVETGLLDLDRLTSGGMRPGELWVVGARPSMGKTAISLTITRNTSTAHAALVLTQEDSSTSVALRQIAAAGRINLSKLRRPQSGTDAMWASLTDAIEQLSALRLYIDDQGGLTLADVRRKIQQVKRRDAELRVVVVDYLQLMDGQGDNRNQALGALANGLKRAAKEFGVTIVLLSQLNREADKRNGVPQIADLRDSGDIEGAADLVLLLHREFRRTNKPHQKHWAQCHVAKHKNGPTETLNLYFDGEVQRFENWVGGIPREGTSYGED